MEAYSDAFSIILIEKSSIPKASPKSNVKIILFENRKSTVSRSVNRQ